MDIRKKYWDSQYDHLSAKKPEYDLWLDKYSMILEGSKNLPIIDLGCGFGCDSLYLSERGYKVISCDLSKAALENVRKYVPNAKTISVDISKELPFEDSSIRVLIADLSLHYFYWNDTIAITNEIKRILKSDGYLLCRLNSTKDANHGAGQGIMLEKDYYAVNGNTKRFFDKKQIEDLFKNWQIEYISEYQMDRYSIPKILWEVAVKK